MSKRSSSNILVQNLEEAKAELLAKGCRIEAEDPRVPRCYVRDPYGLIFNLAENEGA